MQKEVHQYTGEERRCSSSGSLTKVKFDLWAVLGFLVVLAAICLGFLFSSQSNTREEGRYARQQLQERVVKLELNMEYINKGIAELKQGQTEMLVAIKGLESPPKK